MAQSEDTELRDLVVEALEKNGSLAKIRALLRANIFLVFEDDCENIKQNVSLDSILKLPEGIFCLSLIHEFLEYCNLKNTLFVYMSESRQGKEYSYEGTKLLLEKLKLKRNNNKEPVLVTLIKNVFQQQPKTFGHNERHVKRSDNTFKDEQNNTYIVHEDSTTSLSNSNSDNSSDEKNKLHLRLQLDNSDTDTSSDSTRGKTSSEYIPSEHIVTNQSPHNTTYPNIPDNNSNLKNTTISIQSPETNKNISNSESTSYVEIKSLSPLDKILFNTTGVPFTEEKTDVHTGKHSTQKQLDTQTPSTKTTNVSNYNNNKNESTKSESSGKDLTEYSLDFTSASGKKENVSKDKSTDSIHDQSLDFSPKIQDNFDQKSITTPDSISTSDVADILSDKSNSSQQKNNDKNSTYSNKSKSISNYSKKSFHDSIKLLDDDFGDFSESPIPSLSNLSLDIHSD
ncbi:PREDICTED: FGFR1 oncogene partner-like [Papilio polytes]|uniref:FGFR1 oncogene partner-like n=1 Tax=Papilio polytes TaxID=76194 RepID=UPI0006768675|nr:PREDICTED: FGFR1 oncogene partner-like [Papilio polytes]